MLDRAEWKGGKIGEIHEQVQSDHHAAAERERKWNIPSRIFHFAGGERDVVPRVSGEERADLRDAQRDEKAVTSGGADSGGDGNVSTARPHRGDVGVNRSGVA